MAVRALNISYVDKFKDDCHTASWTGLTFTSTDSGAPLEMPGSGDRSVQVFGTLGAGGSVRIEGSNKPSPTVDADYHVLTDPQGNALDITSLKVEQIMELTRWVRPRVNGGDGTTSLEVYLLVRR